MAFKKASSSLFNTSGVKTVGLPHLQYPGNSLNDLPFGLFGLLHFLQFRGGAIVL